MLQIILIATFSQLVQGNTLETQSHLVAYMSQQLLISCKYMHGGGSTTWMFIRWTKLINDQHVPLAVMQNNIFVPEWIDDKALSNFTDHVQLQKEITNNSVSLNLLIDGLKCSDMGTYTCKVYSLNSRNDLEGSSTVDIKVHPGTPFIKEDILEVSENDTFTIICTANVGKPPTEIKWSRSQHGTTVYTSITDNVQQTSNPKDNCTFLGTSEIRLNMTKELDKVEFVCSTSYDTYSGVPSFNVDLVVLELHRKYTTSIETSTLTKYIVELNEVIGDGTRTVFISLKMSVLSLVISITMYYAVS